MLEPDIAWRLKCLHHQIRCDAAAQKVLRVLREIRDRRLEEKYRPDQPRAPRGTPIGGQWIVDPSSARQQPLHDERVQVAVDCIVCGKKHIMKLTPLSMCKECLIKEFGGMKIHEIQAFLEPTEDEDPDK